MDLALSPKAIADGHHPYWKAVPYSSSVSYWQTGAAFKIASFKVPRLAVGSKASKSTESDCCLGHMG